MGSCIHMMRKLANFSGIQVSIVCCLLAMLATNLAFSSSRFGYCFSLVATCTYIESILLVSAYQAIVLSFSLVLCSLIYIITRNILISYTLSSKTILTFFPHIKMWLNLNLYKRCSLAFYLIHIYFCICFR